MILKRTIQLTAFLGMLALTMVPGRTVAQDLLVDQIRDRGELRVLVTNNFPFSYKEPGSDEWTGYMIDLAHEFAGVMEVDLNLQEGNWATLVASLEAGQVDAIFAPMFQTAIRGTLMYLTDPVAYGGHHIVIRADDDRFKAYEDFNDPSVTFAVFPNASETMVRASFPEAQVQIITSDNANAPRMEVLTGRADASITDRDNAIRFVEANPDAKVFPGPPFRSQPIVWGVRPADGHFAQAINVFLSDRRTSGVIEQLGAKYNVQISEP